MPDRKTAAGLIVPIAMNTLLKAYKGALWQSARRNQMSGLAGKGRLCVLLLFALRLSLPTAHSHLPTDSTYATPRVSIRYGDTWGPTKSGATSIAGLYGGKEYYNSGFWRGDTFAPDEINTFFQVQVRIGGKASHTQLSFSGFKQKFNNEAGFGFEAPSALHFGVGYDCRPFARTKTFNLRANIALGAGPEVGVPRFDDPRIIIPRKRFSVAYYSIIGVGASIITRLDATIIGRYTFFLAGTLHHTQTFKQESGIGTQPGQTIGSLALSGGIGCNIGSRL